MAEELVDVIYAVHPEAVVFVSGVDWGYDLRGAINDPVNRNNIIYESHPYPGKGNGWKTILDELMKTNPGRFWASGDSTPEVPTQILGERHRTTYCPWSGMPRPVILVRLGLAPAVGAGHVDILERVHTRPSSGTWSRTACDVQRSAISYQPGRYV